MSIIDSKWMLFLKVTELGSLTHTAAALDAPQSVISRQINALERDCGERLFRRTGRGVVLTDFGQQIFPRIKALSAQADQLADDIRTSSGQPLGDVRLGLLPFAAAVLAGPIYKTVAARLPKVHLHLTEGSSVQLEDWLNQGRLDLSLLLREDDIQRPREQTIRQLALWLIGPAGNPVTQDKTVDFERLSGLPLVLPSEPHLLRAHLTSLASKRHMTLTVAAEADSIGLQREIVAAGGGYAIVPARTTTQYERFGMAKIVNPELSRRMVLSTTTLRPHTLATRAVTTIVTELTEMLET